MYRYLHSFIPALVLAMPIMAEEGTLPPPVPPQPPGALPAGGPNGNPPGGMPQGAMKPEMMKEIREAEGKWRALKEKTDQDPEVLKLKNAVDEAQKAYKAKAQEVMAKDPDYAAIKAQRDDLHAKFGATRPNDGGQGKKKDKGEPKPPTPAP